MCLLVVLVWCDAVLCGLCIVGCLVLVDLWFRLWFCCQLVLFLVAVACVSGLLLVAVLIVGEVWVACGRFGCCVMFGFLGCLILRLLVVFVCCLVCCRLLTVCLCIC